MIPSAIPCACRSPRALQITNRSAIVETSEMLRTRMSSAFLSLAASTTRSASARGGRSARADAVTYGDQRARKPSPIEAALLYVLPHCVRNKVTQGRPASGPSAQFARAYVEPRRIERACVMHRVRFGGTRSRRHKDGGQLADPIRSSPPREIRERITPEDQEELALRAQRLERVDGVRHAVALELD